MTGTRGIRRLAFAATAGALLAACETPVTPSPPGIQPPPPNTPPVIVSLTASRSTLETNEPLQLSAVVTDAESALDRLSFVWTASDGTFTGEGLSVTWQASSALATPATLDLTLTVVEAYPALSDEGLIVTLNHRVSREVTVRVHDSVRELGDMSLLFLNRFANSAVSPEECLVDFSDNCRGKASEREDVERNRENFLILGSTLGMPRVSSLSKYSRADIAVSCAFESRRLKCSSGDSDCNVGGIERASGTCRLTAVYEQARWWLCDSRFSSSSSLSPGMRLFFGADSEPAP